MDTDKDISEVLQKQKKDQKDNPKHKCADCGKEIKYGKFCKDCEKENK